MISKKEISERNKNPNYKFRVKGTTRIYNKIGLAAAACPLDGEVETLELVVVATDPCMDFMDKKKVQKRFNWNYASNTVEAIVLAFKAKFIDESHVRQWVERKYSPITPFEIAQIKMLGVKIDDLIAKMGRRISH